MDDKNNTEYLIINDVIITIQDDKIIQIEPYFKPTNYIETR